ncbi:MAG: hypothetical protein HYX95_01040 [Chloroflexi bacterium]|nr:hypothetical protein [Chloroflexota bacterium]
MDKAKRTAIIAAVSAYLQLEEVEGRTAAQRRAVSPWALSGRLRLVQAAPPRLAARSSGRMRGRGQSWTGSRGRRSPWARKEDRG